MFRATFRPTLHFSRFYSTQANKCLVLAEHNNNTFNPVTLNAITAATKVSSEVNVLVLGSKCKGVVDGLSKVKGVNKVLFQDSESHYRLLPESVSLLLSQLQEQHNFSHIIAPASTNGNNILPRFAASQDVQPISSVIKIESPDVFVRPIYAGNALSKVQSSDKLKILTVRPTAFEPAAVGENSASVEELSNSVSQNLSKWESEDLAKSDRPELTAAKVIVSGGRGMKGPEHFKLLEKLADLFNGAVGASRAAVDDEWVPSDMQVGQTGKVVAPELYIAVGISGAIQHIAGMKDSKVIVVINKDAEAPFFQLADYGLVADLFTAVPELIEKVAAKQK